MVPAYQGEEGQVTPRQQAAKADMAYRDKMYWSEKPALERINAHLVRLMRCSTSRTDRMILWRLIIDAALAAHEQEVQELDSLNFVQADPHTEVPVV